MLYNYEAVDNTTIKKEVFVAFIFRKKTAKKTKNP